MTESIQFDSKQIDFHLEYSDRKSLGITVAPNLEVFVKAQDGTSLEKIKEKLTKKAPWIIRQLSFFLYFHPKTPEHKFVGGESHLYIGRQYRLKVISDELDAKSVEVKLKGQFIEVWTLNKIKVTELVDE